MSRGIAHITLDFQMISFCGQEEKLWNERCPHLHLVVACSTRKITQWLYAYSLEIGNIPLISWQCWKHLLQSSWPCVSFSLATSVDLACKAEVDGMSARRCESRLWTRVKEYEKHPVVANLFLCEYLDKFKMVSDSNAHRIKRKHLTQGRMTLLKGPLM